VRERALLHRALARVRGAGEVVPGLLVVATVALLFLPVGPAALDALLALSLGLSATVLLAVLLSPDALRLSAFPALLLLTTLLRLALAVSSTRLVLARGEAGRVIEALGRVVVQGSWVAGAVVYAILALVQLLVVARGAERVAEVAARFSLDALPGKQMAVDADLRAGAIDAPEARRRRLRLEEESQLHGAMDGALKFVKGDAVAGIGIALVNAVGGMAAGLMRGMSPSAAARRYVLLAVGDGLASQIPGLLVAVAAGVAVTRVAGEGERRSLAGDVARQLAAEPRALLAASALLAALALAPGLPALPFAALAALGAGAAAAARGGSAPTAGRASLDEQARAGVTVAPPPPAAVEIARDGVAEEPGGPELVEAAGAAIRLELWRSLGVPVAEVAVRPAALAPGAWAVLVEGVPAAGGRIPAGQALCLAPADDLRLVGIPCARRVHPLSGEPAGAVPRELVPRAAALAPVLGPVPWSLAEAVAALRRSAHLLVGVQEVQVLLDALEPAAPALVREAARHLPPALVAEVLRRLLEEDVPVRPLRSILQALLAEGQGQGAAALAERCRRSLSRHIAARVCGGPGRALSALILDPAAEPSLRASLAGEVAALSPTEARHLLDSLEAGRASAPRPRALLAPGDLRRPLRNLIAGRMADLPVLAYEELPAELRVSPVGRVALGR
jgi:type III secretion protein V